MRTIRFKIVNEDLYHSKVVDVDVSGLKTMGLDYSGDVIGFKGDVFIELDGDNTVSYSGYHGQYDYIDDYGFIITY